MNNEKVNELRVRVWEGFDGIVEELKSLVRIPSYVTDDSDRSVLMTSATRVAELLRSAGVQDVEILSVNVDGIEGAPGVVGQIPAPAGRPTVLLYAHHDVQPVRDDWDTDPFEPVRKGDRLFGRGAADDGAGIAVHIGALRALGESLGVGIRVFVEGEEESGSPTFATFLRTYADKLRADVAVVADGSNWKVGIPAITSSLRGVVDVDVELRIGDHAVHSGMFGGPILDAPLLLARLLATCHTSDGSVAVKGLRDDDLPMHETPIEYDEEDFRADAGLVDSLRLAGSGSVADHLWYKPSITLIGFDMTPVNESSNTIQPVGRARLSLRVPPGLRAREAQRLLRLHLERNAPLGAQVTVTDGETGEAFLADESSPVIRIAQWAFEQAWQTAPVAVGQGGSIPLVSDIKEVFPDSQVLITGVEDPDTRAHSGNESVHLTDLRAAILGEALILARLADEAAS